MIRSVLLAILTIGMIVAQSSIELLKPWGGADKFPKLYRESLDSFFDAEKAYRAADYARASKILDAFWAAHPAGTRQWAVGNAYAYSDEGRSKGPNFGAPAGYSALRMLTECTASKLRSSKAPVRSVRWTVVLAGNVDSALDQHATEIMAQSTFLFREYVTSMTEGRLGADLRIVRLPQVVLPVPLRQETSGAGTDKTTLTASPESLQPAWDAIDDETKRTTDWWLIIYPSRVPASAVAEQTEAVTGGMYRGPDGRSPAFVIDDLWFMRVPPHLGKAQLDESQRRAYLPQWFQHEFFHHLYATYPSLRLESTPHGWFDWATWPSDFEGLLEADYYAESLRKRLKSASPPLHIALRYQAASKELWAKITPAMIAGKYHSDPLLNDLEGTIDANLTQWKDAAGVSWALDPDLRNGVLRTGADNPYYNRFPDSGRTFRIVLRRDDNGEYLPEVAGFEFLNVFYAKLPL